MNKTSGRLISIEGGEGAGKSTVLAAIKDRLEQRGHTVLVTREPGGTVAGEQIRSLLLAPGQSICARAELLMMFASRTQLVHELVQPAMAAGKMVISDRFTDASFAYQGGGRGLPVSEIAWLETHFVGIEPDLTFLLDVDVEQGLQRAQSRGQGFDRIESERTEFFHAVRAAYRQRAAQAPDRIRIVDAGQTPDAVRAQVLAILDQWLR
jgi:dTMP kinase